MEKTAEKEKKVWKTNRHFEIYLEYVKRYNVLKLKWTVQRGYSMEIQNIWRDMTGKLNQCGGPVRDASHWKKVFTEWKSHTRRKMRCNKPLNDLERQLVELTDLTTIPEKTPKPIKNYKNNKVATNKNGVNNKYNSEIKEEFLDECEDTDNSFVEHETSSEEAQLESEKELTKNVVKNIFQAKEHKAEQKKKIKPTGPRGRQVNDVIKGKYDLSSPKSSDISTQVDEVILGIPNISGLAGIGVALHSLSGAINRYCDIVERRIF